VGQSEKIKNEILRTWAVKLLVASFTTHVHETGFLILAITKLSFVVGCNQNWLQVATFEVHEA